MNRFLGQGSHGSVYDNLDGGKTVTKYVNIMDYGDEGIQERINPIAVVEPCALMRLRECGVPFIVNLVDIAVNSTNTDLKIIMDKCDPMPKAILDDERVRVMVAQLFMAVEGMHQVDVYHGDIKTDNVMLDRVSGGVRVIDFSLAHVDTPVLTSGWEELYTMGYRPPEILLGSPHVDRSKADVWAAGITACEIMLGENRLMKQMEWKGALHEIMGYFGSMPFGGLYPRWPIFVGSPVPTECRGGTESMYQLIKTVRGSDAAMDFISCACSTNPRNRWSARQLLNHPYINDITSMTNCPVRRTIYPLHRIVIRGSPRPHRLFVGQRNVERELITEELLRRLEYTKDNDRAYIAAINICAAYRLDCIIPTYTDVYAIANLLRHPETFQMLSKHIFAHNTDDDPY